MKKLKMSFTDSREMYEMVGYVSGFVVAENEWGEWFVCERPEEFYFPGEMMENGNLIPFSSLAADKQKRFTDYFRLEKEGKIGGSQGLR